MSTKQKLLVEAAAFVDECPTDTGVEEAVQLIAASDMAEVAGPFLADPANEKAGVSHNETVIGLLLAAAAAE